MRKIGWQGHFRIAAIIIGVMLERITNAGFALGWHDSLLKFLNFSQFSLQENVFLLRMSIKAPRMVFELRSLALPLYMYRFSNETVIFPWPKFGLIHFYTMVFPNCLCQTVSWKPAAVGSVQVIQNVPTRHEQINIPYKMIKLSWIIGGSRISLLFIKGNAASIDM